MGPETSAAGLWAAAMQLEEGDAPVRSACTKERSDRASMYLHLMTKQEPTNTRWPLVPLERHSTKVEQLSRGKVDAFLATGDECARVAW